MMEHSLSWYLMRISIWSVIIPLVIGILNYRKLGRESKVIFYLVVLATPPQILTEIIVKPSILHEIYNIYTPIEFVLTYLFIRSIMTDKIFKNIAAFLVFIFFFLSVMILYLHGKSDRFLSEWVCAANTFYLCWMLLYVLESIKYENRLIGLNDPIFWYLSGFLLYTPCTIFFFALSSYIKNSQNSIINNLWIIQGVFNTLLYVCFGIGLFKSGVVFNGVKRLAREKRSIIIY